MSREATTQQPDAGGKSQFRPTAAASRDYKVIKSQVLGRIQWFNVNAGYGFIQSRDTAEDVFVHHSAITSNHQGQHLCCVGDGQRVQFDIVVGKKGPQAANVTSRGGVPIQCQCHGVKNTEKRMVEVTTPEEEEKKPSPPSDPVPKVSKATATEDLTQAHLEQFLKMKQEQEQLKEDLEALKKTLEEEQAALKADFIKNLQAKEESYQQQLEAQKAEHRKEVEQQESRYQEQLETQKAQFQKENESKMDKSWIFIFGGACLFAGFLSGKCLRN